MVSDLNQHQVENSMELRIYLIYLFIYSKFKERLFIKQIPNNYLLIKCKNGG
jgi:hypothetical protein